VKQSGVSESLHIKDTKERVKKHKLSSDFFYRILDIDVLKEINQAGCKDR
jgi:hypothetical protein